MRVPRFHLTRPDRNVDSVSYPELAVLASKGHGVAREFHWQKLGKRMIDMSECLGVSVLSVA